MQMVKKQDNKGNEEETLCDNKEMKRELNTTSTPPKTTHDTRKKKAKMQ